MKQLMAVTIALALAPALFAGGQREGGNFSYNDISRIRIEGGTFDVEITGRPGDDLEMVVENYPDNYNVYHSVDGSSIRVWVEREFSLISLPHDGRLVFRVPEDSEIGVDNSTGDLSISGLRDAEVEAETSTGTIELEQITGRISAHSTTGELLITNADAELELESTTGSIRVRRVSGDIRARSTTGDQIYRDVTGDVDTRSSTGDIEFQDVSGALDVSTSTGHQTGLDVTLTGDSSFEASTGRIEMDLVNDVDSLEFDLTSTTGSLQVGGDRSQRRLFLGSTGIRVEGTTSTGSQRYY